MQLNGRRLGKGARKSGKSEDNEVPTTNKRMIREKAYAKVYLVQYSYKWVCLSISVNL